MFKVPHKAHGPPAAGGGVMGIGKIKIKSQVHLTSYRIIPCRTPATAIMAPPSVADLKKLKVPELKELLSARGLDTSGVKVRGRRAIP